MSLTQIKVISIQLSLDSLQKCSSQRPLMMEYREPGAFGESLSTNIGKCSVQCANCASYSNSGDFVNSFWYIPPICGLVISITVHAHWVTEHSNKNKTSRLGHEAQGYWWHGKIWQYVTNGILTLIYPRHPLLHAISQILCKDGSLWRLRSDSHLFQLQTTPSMVIVKFYCEKTSSECQFQGVS